MTTDYDDSAVTVTWTETTELSYEDEFPAVAKALGVSTKKLAAILDGDDELGEITETAKKRLRKLGDISNDDWQLDEILET